MRKFKFKVIFKKMAIGRELRKSGVIARQHYLLVKINVVKYINKNNKCEKKKKINVLNNS